ncbi:PucR family transcriptional regulator [Bacillus canaveralius]|uniref:PucR family transcriptional regulator n=1 Tax=Bacillus canaveralius TaxID=1403243 RepID=A0A2N5GGD5_9BACI|nr:PucR family transcriptional regulator [Bacillus canaveralius]PLR88294.1 PucR family transcriptional regulator [Bacillus canaveralius]
MGDFLLITVKDVLNTKAFEGAKIIGGMDGLERSVSIVTVAEVPDAANWLRGGELVCTTAYFMSKGVIYQTDWVESLFSNGAVALAIKTGRFLGTVPQAIIDVANRLQFPLIEMPDDITWPIVIESIMNLLMNDQYSVLQRAEEIHTTLTNLVLEDETVQAVADKIASLVGNPIIIEDARLNLIAVGEIEDKINEQWKQLIEKRTSLPARKQIMETAYYENVLRNRTKEKLQISLSKDKSIENITMPILSNRMVYGFVSLIEGSKKVVQMDLIALEHGATALALQFMKQVIHKQTKEKKNIALIDDLVNGRIHTELVNEYQIHNKDWSKPMTVSVLDLTIDDGTEDVYTWNHTENRIIDSIRKHLDKKFDQVIIGMNDSLFTILVSSSNSLLHQAATLLQYELTNILSELKEQKVLVNFSGGIGSVRTELKKLGECFKEAKTALSITKTFPKKGPVLLYEKLGVHRIISMVNSVDELRLFCQEYLSEISAYDYQQKDVLLETLHAYLQCGCNVPETAKKLFVHPNTVTYRLKKIQSLLKLDLNTLEARLTYLFALEANEMLDSK